MPRLPTNRDEDDHRIQEAMTSLAKRMSSFASTPASIQNRASNDLPGSGGMRTTLTSISESLKPIAEAATLSTTSIETGGLVQKPGTSPPTEVFKEATRSLSDISNRLANSTVSGPVGNKPMLPAFPPTPSIPSFAGMWAGMAQPSLPTSMMSPNLKSQMSPSSFAGMWAGMTPPGAGAGIGNPKPSTGGDCCDRIVPLIERANDLLLSINYHLGYSGPGGGGPGGSGGKPPPSPPAAHEFPWATLAAILVQRGIYAAAAAPTAASAATAGGYSIAGAAKLILEHMKDAKLSEFGGFSAAGIGALGGAAAGVAVVAELVDKLRGLANQISAQNAGFGKFSANMQRVAIDRELFDIQLSHERGERRSVWAGDFEKSRQRIEKEWAKTDDAWELTKAKTVSALEPWIVGAGRAVRHADVALMAAIGYALGGEGCSCFVAILA